MLIKRWGIILTKIKSTIKNGVSYTEFTISRINL